MTDFRAEMQQMFPDERGRVNGYSLSRGLSHAARILELGVNAKGLLIPKVEVALLPDQLDDYAFYRGLQERARVARVHGFARVVVQSGLLDEGVTF